MTAAALSDKVPLSGSGIRPNRAEVVPWKGCEQSVTEVKLRRGEAVEKAIRRLKKKMDREGVMREIRARRHFEKPSVKKRRKAARARARAR